MCARVEEADTARAGASGESVILSQQGWDELLLTLDGRMHQSWRWGELNRRYGRDVQRVVVANEFGTAMAQMLIKRRGPISTAYVPRGPLINGDVERLLPELFAEITRICRRYRVMILHVEPEMPLDLGVLANHDRIVTGGYRYTPGRTAIVPLGDDDELIARMHASKRREIRRAERQGIVVEHRRPDNQSIDEFYALMQDTAARNQIRINPSSYYRDYLRLAGSNASLMFSLVNGEIAAGLIIGIFGDHAYYLFGASSTTRRVPGATAYLQFQAMRWARTRGCSDYDLWGIPEADPPSLIGADGEPLRSSGLDDRGLYRFKIELGGERHMYPPIFEIRYRPRLAWAFQQLKAISHVRPS